MKNILKKLFAISFVMTLIASIGTVSAAPIDSKTNTFDNICTKQTHYYYFTLAMGHYNYESVEAYRNQIRDNTLTPNNYILENGTTFDTTGLPEDYVVLSADPEATTTYDIDEFYYWFDAAMEAIIALDIDNISDKILITDAALSEAGEHSLYKLDDTGNIIVTKDSEGNNIYNHIHNGWTKSNSTKVIPSNAFIKDVIYMAKNKATVADQIAYRKDVVEGSYETQKSVTTKVGFGKGSSFAELTADNIDRILSSSEEVTIRRQFPSTFTDNLTPYIYSTDLGSLGNISDVSNLVSTDDVMVNEIPAKVKVTIGTLCHERTCEDTDAEYKECKVDSSCTTDLLAAYEKCHPAAVPNPDTADKNLILVVVAVLGAALVGFMAYRESKLQGKKN